MLEQKVFIDAVKGAVDSYIRMINEINDDEVSGIRKISQEWYYCINPENEDFIILLNVMGEEEEIVLNKSEWKVYNANHLANRKLKELAKNLQYKT